MISRLSRLKRFVRDNRGSAAIETAFVLPVLATMVLGGVEASAIVSRQAELQTAAAEAAAVTLARAPDEADERETLEAIIETSTGLAADKVKLELKYRCDTDATMIDEPTGCGTGAVVSEYIIITMKDSYTPTWTDFGIGSAIRFNVSRRVQIS